jgi:hypothetical protein
VCAWLPPGFEGDSDDGYVRGVGYIKCEDERGVTRRWDFPYQIEWDKNGEIFYWIKFQRPERIFD